MESTPLLYQSLMSVLTCHKNWLDRRHVKTLAWMMSGLILSREIGLGAWALYVHSRAQYVASTIRRFRRFLDNDRIDVPRLYAPLRTHCEAGSRPPSMWRWIPQCCGIPIASCGYR